MLCSCAYLDVVLSYEVRLPFLQDLEEYFHEMIQKYWILWRFYYHLQVTINDIQCDVKWTFTNTQKDATSKIHLQNPSFMLEPSEELLMFENTF